MGCENVTEAVVSTTVGFSWCKTTESISVSTLPEYRSFAFYMLVTLCSNSQRNHPGKPMFLYLLFEKEWNIVVIIQFFIKVLHIFMWDVGCEESGQGDG